MATIIEDLSQEYHPIPKPSKKPKALPKPINKIGKKGKEWNDARAELKKLFAGWNITKCEIHLDGCLKDNFLGFAHTQRRRKLTEEDVKSPDCVVLACQNCHHICDFVMDKEEARKLLEKIIKNRKTK